MIYVDMLWINQEVKHMRHENVVLFDEGGRMNIMVRFTPGEDPEPMFRIRGKIAKAVYISKYENTLIDGIPCSLPLQQPAVNVSFEEAEELCRRKGNGWHLMTNAEWMYLQKEAEKEGTLPHGNTDFGRSHEARTETGDVYDDMHVLTGSGPDTWSHDHTPEGVYDLCGNDWEHIHGLRLHKGMIEYIKDNDAAAEETDTGENSSEWIPVMCDGKPVGISAKNGSLKLTTDNIVRDWEGCRFREVVNGLSHTPEMLEELGIIQIDDKCKEAGFFADSALEEAIPCRGSGFGDAGGGGVGALSWDYPRTSSGNYISFRSAYYEL